MASSQNGTAVGTPDASSFPFPNDATANGKPHDGGDLTVHFTNAPTDQIAAPPNREDFGLECNPNAQSQQLREEQAGGPPGPPEVQDRDAAMAAKNTNNGQIPPLGKRRGSISSLPSSSAEFTNTLAATSASGVTEEMVRWSEKLPLETLVLCEGTVRRPEEDSGGKVKEIKSVEVGTVEIEIHRVCRGSDKVVWFPDY